jgi:hypothetical protein
MLFSVCVLFGVRRTEVSDSWLALLPVATLATFFGLPTGFLAADFFGLLFVELVRLVEALLLRVFAVFAAPWPLPMEAASLGVGSGLVGSDPVALDPAIL